MRITALLSMVLLVVRFSDTILKSSKPLEGKLCERKWGISLCASVLLHHAAVGYATTT